MSYPGDSFAFISVRDFGILDISKSQVHANTAVAGGARVIAFGATRIKHSSITANHGQNGTVGGLFVSGTGTVTDSNISGNTALEAAGVLTDTSTQLTLRSVTLADNTAVAGVGGGLAINPGSSVVTEGGIIANNTATTEGGGIFNLGELVSRNTKIIGNRSDLGGGISNASNTAAANLFGTQVIKNIAITDGGGIVNNGGTVELNTATGTIVVKNRPNNCVGVPQCSG